MATESIVTVRGVRLVRSVEIGPRGGKKVLYQAENADRIWGLWYRSAIEAAQYSNPSDRCGTGAGV